MRIPNSERAVVPPEKIAKYLLDAEHPEGAPKAAFFSSFGFTASRPEKLIQALISHAKENDFVSIIEGQFGTKYVVEALVSSPDGRSPMVRSVWIITEYEPNPRLVTAYGMD